MYTHTQPCNVELHIMLYFVKCRYRAFSFLFSRVCCVNCVYDQLWILFALSPLRGLWTTGSWMRRPGGNSLSIFKGRGSWRSRRAYTRSGRRCREKRTSSVSPFWSTIWQFLPRVGKQRSSLQVLMTRRAQLPRAILMATTWQLWDGNSALWYNYKTGKNYYSVSSRHIKLNTWYTVSK